MEAQDSVRTLTPATRSAPRIHSNTFIGLAGLIGKLRQLVRQQPVTPFAGLSADDREEAMKAARVVIQGQDPACVAAALDLAQQSAEGILDEAGYVTSAAGRALARRIAVTAILTYRLALEGAFDRSETAETAGGVQ